MSVAQPTIAERVAATRERVELACAAVDRDPRSVTVIAVSKTHPPEAAAAAALSGLIDLGENRVQELQAKQAEVIRIMRGCSGQWGRARWHLIGPIQSRKAKDVVDRGWLLHTVDRASLVDALAKRAEQPPRVMVQVNISRDPAKHGCSPEEAEELVDQAVRAGLQVEGLMTIPVEPLVPADANLVSQPHFARLRELRDRIADRHPQVRALSMGMSADLESAIAEGATHVRLGTAVFGPRGPAAWQPSEPTRSS